MSLRMLQTPYDGGVMSVSRHPYLFIVFGTYLGEKGMTRVEILARKGLIRSHLCLGVQGRNLG